MKGTPSPQTISTKQERIAALAKQMPEEALTSLSHHIDIEWLKEAYRRTRKDGATGVDAVTAQEYERELEGNLERLLDAAKGGTYRAPPVKRVLIPKGKGGTRPIGIPTFEDKLLQRAVVMVLEPLYEQDFHDCSHGFRPGRSAHDALESLWKSMMGMGGGWVLEVDIRSYFDTIDHRYLQDILRQRVRDGVVLRLIGKWLNAGVMADGRYTRPSAGTPQGGVISPLLANIYLHEALDSWFERAVKPRLKGRSFLVRYADDFVIGFANEADARKVHDVLAQRFAKYGLELHPDKTRLIRFSPPRGKDDEDRGTFDFLGFTHHWGKSRKGNWVIYRRTAADRLRRTLRHANAWCKSNRHRSVVEQHRILSMKLRGHYAYFGVRTNSLALAKVHWRVQHIWHKWLSRRSSLGLSWASFTAMLRRFPLPPPRLPSRVT